MLPWQYLNRPLHSPILRNFPSMDADRGHLPTSSGPSTEDVLTRVLLPAGVSTWVRAVRRLGFLRSNLILMGSAVCVSVLLNVLIEWVMFGSVRLYIVMLAALTPAVVAPALGFVLFKLVFGLEAMERHLRLLSTTDELTGVLNRRAIGEFGQHALSIARRYRRPVSLVLLDLDFFKRINDTAGHQAGDAVLESIGALLKAYVREVDAVGRYGGEEFLLVLPETSSEGALQLAERLRVAIASLQIPTPAGVIRVTASAGVCAATAIEHDFNQVLQAADVALYRAKHQGRDRVESERIGASS